MRGHHAGFSDKVSANLDLMNKTATTDSIYHVPQTFEVTLNIPRLPFGQRADSRSRNLMHEPQLAESKSV